ncbi:phBC6A51 family helix-turn-helix protein [Methanosalsum natronophilum]|nr:phBC6A51 family helix-turn-helix protein [Methanosalsum natronophilum]MCS3923870.1 hypothetical protein [Methanosalsum natronophilum]
MTITSIKNWTWNKRRLKAAKLLARGDMKQTDIAKECGINPYTFYNWNHTPEFKEKVAELVLLDERATKAGILQRALTTLEKKSELVGTDKSTELDYLKFIANLKGLTDNRSQVNITNAIGIVNSPEVLEKANELSKQISQVYETGVDPESEPKSEKSKGSKNDN